MGGVNEELAPQTSAFTRSPAFICPLEFSIVIPRSRVDGEKNTKISRRMSMGVVGHWSFSVPCTPHSTLRTSLIPLLTICRASDAHQNAL